MANATKPGALTAAEIAKQSAAVMWADDKACSGLGMVIVRVEPGLAALSMSVTAAMVNGHGLAHGGFIFTLADSAFAYACNSRGQRHVAQHCQISYLAPGKLGMTLTATACERQRGERSGIYDVTVCDDAGTVIAEFRGHSRAIPGTLVPGTSGVTAGRV
jgi:acyl-CoA thioesterase